MTLRAPAIGTDTDSSETFRLAMGGLWVPSSALNARTGVTSTPVLTGTGNFTATVGPVTAVIDGTSNAQQGSYPVANDAAVTITIGAANTQPRIDLISLQIQDNAYDGSGQTRCIPVVTAGTPAGSPVAPAAPANSLSLWTVPVAANATSVVFSSATAVYPRTAAAGGIVPVAGATDKPAAVNGVAYRHRLDVAAGGASPLEWSTDGTTYSPVAPAPGMTKIGSVVVSGAAVASMTITVPAGFATLFGISSHRGDIASTATNLTLQLNGDTGTNYLYQFLVGAGSTTPTASNASSNMIFLGNMPGANATSNYFGSMSFTMPSPGSSAFKAMNGTSYHVSTTTSSAVGALGGLWLSTASVTSVTLVPTAGNFVAGSSFTLYGLL